VKQNFLYRFFLCGCTNFDDHTQGSRQRLARGHSFSNTGVFCGFIQLNDDWFPFLFFDQRYWFFAEFQLMPRGCLQIEIR
jgi:hypothetical protein